MQFTTTTVLSTIALLLASTAMSSPTPVQPQEVKATKKSPVRPVNPTFYVSYNTIVGKDTVRHVYYKDALGKTITLGKCHNLGPEEDNKVSYAQVANGNCKFYEHHGCTGEMYADLKHKYNNPSVGPASMAFDVKGKNAVSSFVCTAL